MASLRRDDRGQMQTIEGLGAAMIMLSVLALVVQTTSVTPLTSSFTNQHIKLELQNMGQDILTTLDETYTMNTTDLNATSLLKQSIKEWVLVNNYDWYAWNNTTYVSLSYVNNTTILNTALGNALSYALIDRGVAFNVEVAYPDMENRVRCAKMIWNGDPSENCVTVSRIIVLHDDVYGTGKDIPVDGYYDNSFILPDISPDTPLHNVAEVKLTMWVM
ncbi:hypothetical protein CUJ83_06990 [Methanocella sp. CWC-04]|uniref:Uncharacterized protein n=1 Tax=Methanooceanicella nereidis TaxID=2052831 RepID=A0AAP2RCE1_9EURY|nr:hypothetical protein [Methanocella sp. CWC-04]MCD1294743.1 hypothetical protein [Methanocella sp. CWC-04]